jgi:hypothetical protein
MASLANMASADAASGATGTGSSSRRLRLLALLAVLATALSVVFYSHWVPRDVSGRLIAFAWDNQAAETPTARSSPLLPGASYRPLSRRRLTHDGDPTTSAALPTTAAALPTTSAALATVPVATAAAPSDSPPSPPPPPIKDIHLAILILSDKRPKSYELRQTARRTYLFPFFHPLVNVTLERSTKARTGSPLPLSAVQHWFVVGIAEASADELATLHKEQDAYGDMLFLPIGDAYRGGSMLKKYFAWMHYVTVRAPGFWGLLIVGCCCMDALRRCAGS